MLALRVLAASLLLAALPAAAASPADREIAAAEERLAVSANASGAHVALAAAFMRKARESGDPAYYTRARAALERALVLDPGDYTAIKSRAWVLLGLHDFHGALAAAEEARRLEPADWWNYANLTDAWVELGDYPRALAAAQRMMDLRPGLPAYTRAAYLRSLHGDRAGALELYELAVRAASPSDPESLAWALVHLGHEHFAAGELAAAGAAHARALAVLPDYHLGLAGLARVRAAEGRLDEAIDLYRRAVERVPAPDVVAALGDAYAAAGDAAAAERQYALVEHMAGIARATGTTYGRHIVLFLADHERQPAEALRLARLEASARDDIYTADALAWALHANGREREAARAAHRALRLGTPEAALHYHAGAIAAALGRERVAVRHLRQALALNPHFDLLQAGRARDGLAALHTPALAALR